MDLIDVIVQAHNMSVMINKRNLEQGLAGFDAIARKGEDKPVFLDYDKPMVSNTITLRNTTKAEVDAALENDPLKRFYWEGSFGCDSQYYDFNITPSEIEKERGICTEHESHIRVPFGDEEPQDAQLQESA